MITYGFNFAVAIFSGFMGNALYKTKAQKDIAASKQEAASPEGYRMLLFKKGGVSVMLLLLSLVGYMLASELFTMLLQQLK
jgi:hypothetical protein